MDLSDIDLIIKELKQRQQEFVLGSRYANEPEGKYAALSLEVVNSQLRLLRDFKKNHTEISAKEARLSMLKFKLRKTAQSFVDTIIEERRDDYFDFITDSRLDRFKDTIRSCKGDIQKAEKELETADFSKKILNKSDFIYQLTEDLYDDRLEHFEIDAGRDRPFLDVSRSDRYVTLELKLKFEIGDYFFKSHRQYLASIGFSRIDNRWVYSYDILEERFDVLITAIARSLFEILGAANQEVEVKFMPYQ